MLELSIIFVAALVAVYLLRRNLRRMFYVLWTGEQEPDWEVIYRRWYGEAGTAILAKDRGGNKEAK